MRLAILVAMLWSLCGGCERANLPATGTGDGAVDARPDGGGPPPWPPDAGADGHARADAATSHGEIDAGDRPGLPTADDAGVDTLDGGPDSGAWERDGGPVTPTPMDAAIAHPAEDGGAGEIDAGLDGLEAGTGMDGAVVDAGSDMDAAPPTTGPCGTSQPDAGGAMWALVDTWLMEPGSELRVQLTDPVLRPTLGTPLFVSVGNDGVVDLGGLQSEQPLELRVDGYFFDARTADVSSDRVGLLGLSAAAACSPMRVNVVTHLAAPRARALALAGASPARAIEQAKADVLASLGLAPCSTGSAPCAGPDDEAIILLATATALQLADMVSGSSGGDLSALLQRWSDDLADGVMDDGQLAGWIAIAENRLDDWLIRDLLGARLTALGLGSTVPSFGHLLATDRGDTWQHPSIQVTDSAGNADVLVTQLSETGELGWTLQIGTSEHEQFRGQVVDAEGNTYVIGNGTGDFTTGQKVPMHGFLAKIDSVGQLQWVDDSLPGQVWSIAVRPEGGAYEVGTASGSAYLRARDPDGQLIWERLFAEQLVIEAYQQLLPVSSDGYAVTVTSSGDILASARTIACLEPALFPHRCQLTLPWTYAGRATDSILARYRPDGDRVWRVQWGTEADETPVWIAADADGRAYVAASGLPVPRVLRFSADGVPEWEKAVGFGRTNISALAVAGDALLVAGQTDEALDGVAPASRDSWLARYRLDGERVWLFQFGSLAYDYAAAIIPRDPYVYVQGITGKAIGTSGIGPLSVYGTRFALDAPATLCGGGQACAPDEVSTDADADGVTDSLDICPLGPDFLDSDGDRYPDACDRCPGSDDHIDMDLDGIPDGCGP